MQGFDPGLIWAGRTVVIIGGGPSLSLAQIRHIGMARSKDSIRVVAVNDAVFPAWFADILWACDQPWIDYYSGVPGFSGHKITLSQTKFQDWRIVENTGSQGFEPKRGAVRSGGNGVYQALNFMAHLGAKRIALIGVDMAGGHWHGDHPGSISSPRPNWDNRCRDFEGLAEALLERNISVVNCSPGTRLRAFPLGELEQTLRMWTHG